MFSVKSLYSMIIGATIVFMFLNAFLPLNLSSVETEATQYPFKLAIALEKTTYRPGDLVNVTWTLTNLGEENVTLYNSRDDPLDFIVRDEDFNHVFRYRTYHGVFLIVGPVAQIAPNGNIIFAGTWEQIYDNVLESRNPTMFMRVLPGIYYVSGFFKSTTYNVAFETTPIRITII
ncbi:MAG TPA: BsuPI-related putative proteinase inhibitor [Candidatus Bathyarchaeia archaeon]